MYIFFRNNIHFVQNVQNVQCSHPAIEKYNFQAMTGGIYYLITPLLRARSTLMILF